MEFRLDQELQAKYPARLINYWKMGLLCNLFNPKVALFLAVVTLPFMSVEISERLEIDHLAWAILLWATIFLEGLLLWSLWVILLQHRVIKTIYQRSAGIIDGVFGVILIVLAGVILFD
jgi:threonine efflux protein